MLEFKINEFEVRKVRKGWIVRNINGDYENHSHFYFSRKAAIRCAIYADRKIIRKAEGSYMLEACRRITLDDDYKRKLIQRINKTDIDKRKSRKEKYVNKNTRTIR